MKVSKNAEMSPHTLLLKKLQKGFSVSVKIKITSGLRSRTLITFSAEKNNAQQKMTNRNPQEKTSADEAWTTTTTSSITIHHHHQPHPRLRVFTRQKK